MQAKAPTLKNTPVFSAFAILRVSVGVVYFWFGALKFFQGLSPAEQLAMQTIHKITFGLINDRLNIIMLASWECLVGVFLITGKWIKPALMLLFLHMSCTFSPFIFFPDKVFHIAPYDLSLTGQYIVKNIIIIAAGLVLWKVETQKAIASEVSSIASESDEFMQGKKIREHSIKEYAINDNGINNL